MVGPHSQRDAVQARKLMQTRYLSLCSVDVLIRVRSLLNQLLAADPEDQISLLIKHQRVHALEDKLDRPRIRARGDDEVVFQLALGTVIDDIDAWINVAVLHLLETRYFGVPVCLLANEVIRFAWELLGARAHRGRVGPRQGHRYHSSTHRLSGLPLMSDLTAEGGCGWFDRKERAGIGEHGIRRCAARNELDPWCCPANVRFEGQREIAIRLYRCSPLRVG